jgi:superfamily II DNA or RNA helicase
LPIKTGKKFKKLGSSPETEKPERRDAPQAPFQLDRIEFHRQGMALVPEGSDLGPGVAYFIKGDGRVLDQRYCSCSLSARRTCPHLLRLSGIYQDGLRFFGGISPGGAFQKSSWYLLAALLAPDCRETAESVKLQFLENDSSRIIRVTDSQGEEMVLYLSPGPDGGRLLDRFDRAPADNQVPSRAALLKKLAELTWTDPERAMNQMGYQTYGQVFEQNFWHRFAYHGFREFFGMDISFIPAIEEESGRFMVTGKHPGGSPLFHLVIPRNRVKGFLKGFRELLPNQHGLAIHPLPLKSIFKISATTRMDLTVRPLIQVLQADGEVKYLKREGLEKFRYGDLIYVKELGILAELEPPGPLERKFAAPIKMVLKKSQVPGFLEEYGKALRQGAHLIDPSIKQLIIHSQVNRVEISPRALDRDWCWLDLRYGIGNTSLSLTEILKAREAGQRYIPVQDGWVDCQSLEVEGLPLLKEAQGLGKGQTGRGGLKLSRLDLFRLQAGGSSPWEVVGATREVAAVKDLLALRPAKPLGTLKGLKSPLRDYQKVGVDWLSFLFENRLGGLLCDDMGLGKTHQVMALMVKLREKEKNRKPFLVVCPTTVLTHWSKKIFDQTRGLKAQLFHGGERDLAATLKKNQVLLTTYGILRNDIDQLKEVPFALAVFDEIQNLKNAETLTYQAAQKIQADTKLGLTGTPIENRLFELKSLLDLVALGYLGSDQAFTERYVKPIEGDLHGLQRKRLNRMISPLVLRRLKKTVLAELPEKIEDLRFCSLSEDQVRLYREAIASRGRGLLEALQEKKTPVPYIHIFALLTLLKQICDHPALVVKKPEDYGKYESGKWELFRELLEEGLGSGQKIVVYSQFLGMIGIIERFLKGTGVGFVALTGSSRKRGELIARFNEDPDCRVFLGSLKAGGTGIDLVAASLVIHYDRWWNAAREDQATDRVHRIGQQRGVQVFKLVTTGTLEEKIAAIIEKKKNLMEAIVREDDPHLLKTFTREELIELLT